MHLAFVSSTVPLAGPASGFDIANRALGEALIELGHDVTFVGFAPPGAEPAFASRTELLAQRDFTTDRAGLEQQLRWLGAALTARTSYSSAKMLTVSPRRFAAVLDAIRPLDGLVLNSVQLAGAFMNVVADHPSVYVAHNVEHVSAQENARMAGGALERLLLRREARYLERLEAFLCRQARHVFALAEEDRAALCGGDTSSSSVLPLVTSAMPPPVRNLPMTHDIGLIGTWTWRPNRIGLMWFLEEVVPHLPEDVSIEVAGGIGPLPSCSHRGVKFRGRVEDARAFVETSGVVALASRGGTGVQLKTLEAFELGVPTVATESALRGIATRPANCIVAEDPRDFARGLAETVSRRRRGEACRVDGKGFHSAQRGRLLDMLDAGLQVLTAGGGSRPGRS